MTAIGHDTLKARKTLTAGGKSYDYFSLDVAAAKYGTGTPIEDPPREQEVLDAVADLSLAPGVPVHATVKATEVTLYH